jgi:hypothetical protein
MIHADAQRQTHFTNIAIQHISPGRIAAVSVHSDPV